MNTFLLDDVAGHVEETLGRDCWIDRDLGWVKCPGQHQHTTKNGPRDCVVFVNYGSRPRLSCFHTGCAVAVADANRRLGETLVLAQSKAFAKKEESEEEKQIRNEYRIWSARARASKSRLLSEFAWTADKMGAASPVKPDHDPVAHAAQLLNLFQADDVVWTGSLYDSGGPQHACNFLTKKSWQEVDALPNQFVCPSAFKKDIYSRSAVNVLNRRFLVVESDTLSKDEIASVFLWLKRNCGLHLAAVVDTAGKSIHGWFKMPDAYLEARLKIILPALGCDPAMFRPSQVCRLPGAERDGAHQRLLYLDAAADNSPCNPDRVLPLPSFYYDGVAKNWFIPNENGGWFSGGQRDADRHLEEAGYSKESTAVSGLSDRDQALNLIQREQSVDYASPLAGYQAGPHEIFGRKILVTSSPRFLVPVRGSHNSLDDFFEHLLGREQLRYFFSWLHWALLMFDGQTWRPGQVVAFAGPVNSGKSLTQDLLTKMFGGREADPYKFMTDRTTFNGNLFIAEHLKIEDKNESTDIRTRRHLGSFIKEIAVNASFDCERKHADALSLTPRRRMTISLNDEPERMMVLPPMDTDVKDKLMLFKVAPYPMPKDKDEKQRFCAQLYTELPAFIDTLLSKWSIPPDIAADRTGVASFHHPDLLEMLDRTAPEQALLELIDDHIFSDSREPLWQGRARELIDILTDPDKSCSREAGKLLPSRVVCGKYLKRLSDQMPERVEGRKVDKYEEWTIHRPATMSGQYVKPLRSISERMEAQGMHPGPVWLGIPTCVPISDSDFDTIIAYTAVVSRAVSGG